MLDRPLLGTPQIVRVGPQLAAVIRLTLPRHQLRQVMGPAFAELQAEASVQGLTLGPAFTRPLRPPGDVVELEAGFEVDRPIRPVGRVRRGELPAATVVRSVYRGPYEGLAAAWAELRTWIAHQGLVAGADHWERYLTGAESGSEPAAWRTELNREIVIR